MKGINLCTDTAGDHLVEFCIGLGVLLGKVDGVGDLLHCGHALLLKNVLLVPEQAMNIPQLLSEDLTYFHHPSLYLCLKCEGKCS